MCRSRSFCRLKSNGLPGTYLNGFYEARPLPYAEAGYGYPEAGQTVVNVTNGTIIRLLVEDEPFDVRFGQLPWSNSLPNLLQNNRRQEEEGDLTCSRVAGQRGPQARL